MPLEAYIYHGLETNHSYGGGYIGNTRRSTRLREGLYCCVYIYGGGIPVYARVGVATYDLPFSLGSQILKIPDSKGLVFNFHFGTTLRASSEAV